MTTPPAFHTDCSHNCQQGRACTCCQPPSLDPQRADATTLFMPGLVCGVLAFCAIVLVGTLL